MTAVHERAERYALKLRKRGFSEEASRRYARRRFGNGCFHA